MRQTIKIPGGSPLVVDIPSAREIETEAGKLHLDELRRRLTAGRDALDRGHSIKAATVKRRKSGNSRPFVDTGRLVRGMAARRGEVSVSVDRLEAASKLEDMGRPVVAVLEDVMDKQLRRIMDESLR